MKMKQIINDNKVSTPFIVFITILAVVIFTVMLTVSWVWGTYNTFVIAKFDIATQWSNVKTEYQRRADLIYNMVEITQSYAKFEKETMTEVVKARGGNFGSTKKEEMKSMTELDTAISRLLLVWEQYPNLKAIEQYNKLTEELQRTENRVQIARSDYNSVVRSYNILISKFPNSILAGAFNYREEDFFENKPRTEEGLKIEME